MDLIWNTITKAFNNVIDLVREIVPDKDKQNQIIEKLEVTRQQVYMVELNTKTVPWVDALHKMGRQILLYLTLGVVFYCIYKGVEINQNLLLILGGPQAVYHFIKGKGK